MIGDSDLKVAKLYGMLPASAGDSAKGRTAADNATVRNVYVIGPDKQVKLMITYPMSTGRNFDEVLRVIDSLQLTAKHKVATPVNWKRSEEHTSELQSLMRISYAVFCLKKTNTTIPSKSHIEYINYAKK